MNKLMAIVLSLSMIGAPLFAAQIPASDKKEVQNAYNEKAASHGEAEVDKKNDLANSKFEPVVVGSRGVTITIAQDSITGMFGTQLPVTVVLDTKKDVIKLGGNVVAGPDQFHWIQLFSEYIDQFSAANPHYSDAYAFARRQLRQAINTIEKREKAIFVPVAERYVVIQKNTIIVSFVMSGTGRQTFNLNTKTGEVFSAGDKLEMLNVMKSNIEAMLLSANVHHKHALKESLMVIMKAIRKGAK